MATNFLWYTGSSANTGLLGAAISLQTTEMNSLASGSTAVSTVGGVSGAFTNSFTFQGMIGEVYLTLGTIGSAMAAGANLAGWFLASPDAGSTYEHTVINSALSRPPDFLIPLPATTNTAGWIYKGAGPIMIPALIFKVYVQNNSGQAFAASGNTLKLAPYAMQY